MGEMIRRQYVLPLRPDASPAVVEEMLEVLRDADRFIPGLLDSSAAVADGGTTVIWENSFVDEAAYTGPYMVHPYHVAAIDDFLMPDSPTALVFRSYAARFTTDDATQTLRSGIRRVVLLSLDSDEQIAAVEALTTDPPSMTTSAFGRDDVGWVSGKGRAFTHVWEQGFVDRDELQAHLDAADGSGADRLAELGLDDDAMEIFVHPFSLRPTDEQDPPPMPADDVAVLYSLTHRVTSEDAAELLGLLERHYDPFMADNGARLVGRTRSVEGGYPMVEIDSAWELPSLASYNDMRSGLAMATDWGLFVRDSIPLIRGGRRRFHRLDQ